ncbi:MAG: tryptophan--tRNA ligase [Enterobacterales bacterium]
MKKPIIFSGMQPSGCFTIGNYIGALYQWIKLQNSYDCIYSITDLHSITTHQCPNKLKKNTLDMMGLYLSSGLNPNICTIFVQSHVPEHSQLNWILSCYTHMGELTRMHQFKKKSIQYNKNINNGLLNYPILMASDILLYQTNKVPVGKDQKQHVELIRNLSQRFNKIYGNVFSVPEILTMNYGGKIKSLLSPNKKMSKSDTNSNNVIYILDKPNVIYKKIKRALTDSDNPPVIRYDPINKPSISNLLDILTILSGISISNLENMFFGKMYIHLKDAVYEAIIHLLLPLHDNYFNIRSDEKYLIKILKEGSNKAQERAKLTLSKVHEVIGI